MTVTMRPASPKAGEPVRFLLEATLPTATCCHLHIWFGDGLGWPTGAANSRCDSYGTSKRADPAHTYNAHGRVEIMFSAIADGCQLGGPIGTLFASFDVAAGVSTGQGPALPQVQLDTTVRPPEMARDLSCVTVVGDADDEDGHITRLVLDWGDGAFSTACDGTEEQRGVDTIQWRVPR